MMRLVYLESRRRLGAASVARPANAAVVVPFRKTGAPTTDYADREQEPETLMAALSLAAVVLTLLTSLAMKLWIW
jgi:hypothetical protein